MFSELSKSDRQVLNELLSNIPANTKFNIHFSMRDLPDERYSHIAYLKKSIKILKFNEKPYYLRFGIKRPHPHEGFNEFVAKDVAGKIKKFLLANDFAIDGQKSTPLFDRHWNASEDLIQLTDKGRILKDMRGVRKFYLHDILRRWSLWISVITVILNVIILFVNFAIHHK